MIKNQKVQWRIGRDKDIFKMERKKDLLRFITAGSVDDGKSTLIGRLLYDSKLILEDQLESIKKTSTQKGLDDVDLSLLVDGLKAEREQGITIDIAHRYFETKKRKFIIADCPGHVQYTRNMITGASNTNLAVVLVDASKGITEQTKRHLFIVSLMQVPHIIICINKMDVMKYDEEVFENIRSTLTEFSSKLDIKDIHFIPTSALKGDNIVDRSTNMPWYNGTTLLYLLENIYISGDYNLRDPRYLVQYVIRDKLDGSSNGYRGYAGRTAGGNFKKGDKVFILPSGQSSKIKSIEFHGEEIKETTPPFSSIITLEDQIDISRGDLIARENNHPEITQDLELMVCWLSNTPLDQRKNYIIKHTFKEARSIIKEILYKININTLHREESDKNITMNDIGRIKIRTSSPLVVDSYSKNKITGSLILIDPDTNETVAACMIR